MLKKCSSARLEAVVMEFDGVLNPVPELVGYPKLSKGQARLPAWQLVNLDYFRLNNIGYGCHISQLQSLFVLCNEALCRIVQVTGELIRILSRLVPGLRCVEYACRRSLQVLDQRRGTPLRWPLASATLKAG